MRHWVALLAIAACLIVTPRLAAQPEASDNRQALEQRVTELVRQLDHRELAQRQQAERQLIELGPDVLALLPSANNRLPAEMRQRLARIATTLQQQAATQVIEPSKITLSGRMPLDEAMRQLGEQSGNKIAGSESFDMEVETGFDETPFWEAFDRLLDQAELMIDSYGGQLHTLALLPRPTGAPPIADSASYHGAFRISALRMTATRDLRRQAFQSLRVSLSVAWEPRLAPISIKQSLNQVKATDDQGQPIPVAGRGVREAPIHPGMSAIELELPFELPDRSVTAIQRLSGELNVLIPGRVERFSFDGDLANARAVEQQRAGVTVILDDVRKNVDLHQFRIRVRFDDAGEALESHRGWIFSNEAYLLDADGQRIDNIGLETTRQLPNEVGVAYLFDIPGGLDGYKFVYETPALILRTSVPYELKDLPLP